MMLAAFNLPTSEIVTAIYQLLPGFVSAWIFFGFTAHAKPAPFERVIQALIFTLFAEALAQLTGFCFLKMGEGRNPAENWGEWNLSVVFIWKVGYAVLMGFVFAIVANNNWLHGRLPNWITKRTSYPSEWFSAFNRTQTYVYLHLDDGRRVYGWLR